MEPPEIPIAGHPTRTDATRAVDALQARGLRCGVPESPRENSEWDVHVLHRISRADAERHLGFLRAHADEPTSW